MFKFRFQTILDIRTAAEETARQHFCEHQQALGRETERLGAIRRQKRELFEALRGVQGRVVRVSEIVARSEQIGRCRRDEEEQDIRVADAARALASGREALLDAVRQRKIIEKLKAREGRRQQAAESLLERNAIDEIAVVRHAGREAK